MKMVTLLGALTLALGFAVSAPASAKTLNVAGAFEGGQLGDVEFDVLITSDFTENALNATDGIVVNTFTSSVLGSNPFELGFNFFASTGAFQLGGIQNNVNTINVFTNDFTLFVADILQTGATPFLVLDTVAAQPSIGFARVTEFNANPVVDVAPVPLPASALLLLGGVAGLAGLRRKRRKAA